MEGVSMNDSLHSLALGSESTGLVSSDVWLYRRWQKGSTKGVEQLAGVDLDKKDRRKALHFTYLSADTKGISICRVKGRNFFRKVLEKVGRQVASVIDGLNN